MEEPWSKDICTPYEAMIAAFKEVIEESKVREKLNNEVSNQPLIPPKLPK